MCPDHKRRVRVAFPEEVAYGPAMEVLVEVRAALSPSGHRAPAHVPSGAALLAVRLSEEARGIRGLDVLRRSVDRAPPVLG